MERREAPGRCATAPLGPSLAIGTGKRALQGRACEASPPNRCASRRSTGRLRLPASGPGCGWPDLRPRFPGPLAWPPPHESGTAGEQ